MMDVIPIGLLGAYFKAWTIVGSPEAEGAHGARHGKFHLSRLENGIDHSWDGSQPSRTVWIVEDLVLHVVPV